MPDPPDPTAAGLPLELSAPEMRALLDAVRERVVEHVASLPAQPAADVAGGAALARELFEPEPPETPSPAAEILDLLFERAIPKSFNTAGPGYLAYVPGGGLFASAVADLVSGATNRYVGVWEAAPALVQLETNVIRWLCGLAGLPGGSGGYLATGGSLASFTAVVAARREKLPPDFLKGTLYVSDQTHHAVTKAASLAGFPAGNVRAIPSDEKFRVRVDLLAERVAADREAGFTPFFVCGNAGTTNTGAVDDLVALADLAARERLWMHVDAAYGGFFLLTKRGRAVLAGIERADSAVLDPHKGLFLPYGTGALLVRDAEVLRRAHAAGADYLPHMQEDPGFVDTCEISPELSRANRGLRVWLPVKLHGLGAFRRSLDEKLDLALLASRELTTMPGIEIVAEPQLSIVAFRLAKPGLDAEALNRLNRELIDRVNARKRIHISGTVLGGSFVLRICVLSFRTHLERLREGLEDLRAAISEVRDAGAGGDGRALL
jgi:aromatic-L-amino-acid decarboxylase